MKHKILTRRCPRCGAMLIAGPERWEHANPSKYCKYTAPRFIKPDTASPLFLNVHVKKPEDKKFLEDIMQEPETQKQPEIFKEIKDDGTVFIKQRNPDGKTKTLEVTNIYKLCKKMVDEMKGGENR